MVILFFGHGNAAQVIPGVTAITYIAVILLIPNLLFGPSIFAFWRGKSHRIAILVVNVFVLFAFFITFTQKEGGPVILDVVLLSLWVWAISCGKLQTKPTTNKRTNK
jgi:hypothetical protein